MIRRTVLSCAVSISAVFSGCFIETGPGDLIVFDGSMEIQDETFSMSGEVVVTGDVEEDPYQNISVEYYTSAGQLLHKESIGSLSQDDSRESIAVEIDQVPEYIIFDSPDIWDGDTSVVYYVRDEQSASGYRAEDTTKRDKLPITPDQ